MAAATREEIALAMELRSVGIRWKYIERGLGPDIKKAVASARRRKTSMIQTDPSLEDSPTPPRYENPDDEPWPEIADYPGPRNYVPPGEQ